jgi:bifunctional UDP-N-acetylglucosamine pyrophosphorylase/glucosamine-1-phosphate N-acetyltransferase
MSKSPTKPVRAVVMAAGQGTRMKSARPKVLHALLGRPMVGWVVEAAREAGCEAATVVVGHGREQVQAYLAGAYGDLGGAGERFGVGFAVQAEQRGTAHAVQQALPSLEGFGTEGGGRVLILNGDLPCLPVGLIRELLAEDDRDPKALSIVSVHVPNPRGFGRIVRDAGGGAQAIVEEKDCDDAQRAITEINTGIYLVAVDFLREGLGKVRSENAQGEFYLTDLLAMAAQQQSVRVKVGAEAIPLLGVNDRSQLAVAQGWLQRQTNERWMAQGVTFLLPGSTLVEYGVELAADVELGPNTSLLGATKVGEGSVIGANCVLENVEVGAGVVVSPGEIWRGARRLA